MGQEIKQILDKGKIIDELRKINDPEIGHNIVDLGLIYEIKINGKNVNVLMTFTSPFCPAGEFLIDSVQNAVENLGGKAKIEVTFDPPWSAEKIQPDLRAAMGIEQNGI